MEPQTRDIAYAQGFEACKSKILTELNKEMRAYTAGGGSWPKKMIWQRALETIMSIRK